MYLNGFEFINDPEHYDYDSVKDRIVYRLVGYEKNKEKLELQPHERFLKWAKLYYFVQDEKGIVVSNSLLDVWGVSIEEIKAVAEINTPRLLPARFEPISETLAALDKERQFPRESEQGLLYILTNTQRQYGAATLSYPGLLKEIAAELHSDLLIIPGSEHENLIMKYSCEEDIQFALMANRLVNMLRQTRETVTAENVYIYRRESDRIESI